MTRWWIADTHANHPNIIRYCSRPWMEPGDLDAAGMWVSPEIAFLRAEQMNAALIQKANDRVKKEDTVVCVGDFACRGGERGVQGLHIKPAELLEKLNGTWVLLEGNHDPGNSVKSVCDFMSCRIGLFRVGVQHRPLYDDATYRKWLAGTDEERAANPWRERMSEEVREKSIAHARYCLEQFNFMICGHVHNAWHTKMIAGVWHVNVGVDVNRYMPVNDMEVLNIFQRAKKGA